MTWFPVFLGLEGREAVVVGGGGFALAKTRDLLGAGARVTVVAEDPLPELHELADAGRIDLIRRAYRTGDLDRAWLAVAAEGEAAVRGQIKRDAERSRVWLNAVDDLPNCAFITGSVHRQGDIVVAVTTGGACPALAVRLRQMIGRWIGPEFGAFAALAARLRRRVGRRIPEFDRRKRFWYSLVDSDAVRLFRAGRGRDAGRLAHRLLATAVSGGEAPAVGRVVLVGAGPGHPGLITSLGAAWLRAADVIVHDRLVSPELLAEASAGARLVDVGKRPDRPSIGQDEINQILIDEARAGHLVVRLKGGDSFVFGRGSEEVSALARAGIPSEVVPGVTSAVAVPAAAGIPVTRRGEAGAFVVVTGRETGGAEPLDWDAVARIPTVVVLMGVSNLAEIAERLVAAGRPAETPAAVVMDGSLPTQRTVRAPLGRIGAAVLAAGLEPPAILVVGDVAAFDAAGPALAELAGAGVAPRELAGFQP